jgi:phosphatidate cytidylyltransferase
MRDFFMALNLKTLTTRTLTATVFVAVLLTCICTNYITFSSLFLVISIWGLYEFYQLSEKLGNKPYKLIGCMIGSILFGINSISSVNTEYVFLNNLQIPITAFLVFSIFIFALFDNNKNVINNTTHTITGLIYAVSPFILLVKISTENYTYNYHYLLGIILLIWSSDVFAYLVGSLIGKHKLFERISPGKTWEGTIGSAILTIGSSILIAGYFTELALIHWVVIAIIVSVFGTIGDLVESMLKRQAGVKDSGKIMPGHGGILDRFDSLLFVAPFVYYYLSIAR